MHVSTSKRNALETLCLDELLQKALSFKPNLRWNIRNEWCRYCGARASTFSSSPWGPKKLCYIHHTMWKNNELNLKAVAEPINIDSVVDHSQCTEKQYLIDILLTLNDNPGKRRSLRSINVHPKHSYISQMHSDFEEYDEEESFCSSYSMSSEAYESSDKEMNDDDTIKHIKQEHDPSTTSNASVMHLYNKLFKGTSAENKLLSHPTSTHVKLKIEPQVSKEDKTKKWRKYYKYKRKTVAKLIVCNPCNKQFKSHRAFRDHMLDVHGIERPYKCPRCGDDKETRYANNAGLIKHIRRDHDKIRDFKCTLCPKAFFDKSVLQSHQRVHDKKKPYRCSYCDKRCTQRSSLRQHILAIHLKVTCSSCFDCMKKYISCECNCKMSHFCTCSVMLFGTEFAENIPFGRAWFCSNILLFVATVLETFHSIIRQS